MKNFLRNYINLFVYIFFVLYILIMRFNDKTYSTFYSVSLIVLAIFLIGATIILNKSKVREVCKSYYLTMFSISGYLIVSAIQYLFIDKLYGNLYYDLFMLLFLAISIVGILISSFYTLKNIFKKGYSLQQFDYFNLKLLINEIVYIIIVEVLLKYSIEIISNNEIFIRLNSSPLIITIIISTIFFIPLNFVLDYYALKDRQPK